MQLPGETTIKAIAGAVIVALLTVLAVKVYRDFTSGTEAKVELRHAQGELQGAVAAHVAEQASTTTSEAIADSTRAAAVATTTATTKATAASVATIERTYVDTPALAAPCRPDGGPSPVPAGVLAELDQAAAAIAEAAPAAR